MIRIVLVEWSEGEWRTYRQPQWMAQVRDVPEAATRPRLHFDIPEDRYAALLRNWASVAGDRGSALGALTAHGGVEILRR